MEYYYEIVHHADGVKEERLKVGVNSKLSLKPGLFLFLVLRNLQSCSSTTKMCVNPTLYLNPAFQNKLHLFFDWRGILNTRGVINL